ncbi:hypothetical protein MAR_016460 [Mya arenaria]|uniref:Uncharacterized protein n=1 Tax=Mya arenaria TaxID=6604 RepID=A0ABY7FNI4_MYAAR|nr:hypothetical protein MAR_016460 [Mya arenaria]
MNQRAVTHLQIEQNKSYCDNSCLNMEEEEFPSFISKNSQISNDLDNKTDINSDNNEEAVILLPTAVNLTKKKQGGDTNVVPCSYVNAEDLSSLPTGVSSDLEDSGEQNIPYICQDLNSDILVKDGSVNEVSRSADNEPSRTTEINDNERNDGNAANESAESDLRQHTQENNKLCYQNGVIDIHDEEPPRRLSCDHAEESENDPEKVTKLIDDRLSPDPPTPTRKPSAIKGSRNSTAAEKTREKRYVSFSDSYEEGDANERNIRDRERSPSVDIDQETECPELPMEELDTPQETDDLVMNDAKDSTKRRGSKSSKRKRRSEETNGRRKESFEQRLRRTFTIKDRHTSEVTRRIIAILIKYSLFVFNFISWVIAVAAIGLGIWMRNDSTFFVTSDTEFYLDLPLMTCIGGGFFYVLSVILLGEVALAIAVFVIYTVPEARDNFLSSQPEKILSTAIQRYMDNDDVKEWVDKIQSEVRLISICRCIYFFGVL